MDENKKFYAPQHIHSLLDGALKSSDLKAKHETLSLVKEIWIAPFGRCVNCNLPVMPPTCSSAGGASGVSTSASSSRHLSNSEIAIEACRQPCQCLPRASMHRLDQCYEKAYIAVFKPPVVTTTFPTCSARDILLASGQAWLDAKNST
jgi:hypothetical protein